MRAAARRPVVVTPLAERDIADAVAYYQSEGGEALADRFVTELAAAFDRLAHHPGIGSPRYATMLRLPGVRSWPLRRWPQLIFYVEREQSIDVFRVLHGAQDIPASLTGRAPQAEDDRE